MKVLVTPTSLKEGTVSEPMERLRAFAGEIVYNPAGRPLEEDELIPLLSDCDGYIAGLDQVTEKVLTACPKLKCVSRYGVGCDGVDLEAAARLGITVTNTPGMNSQAVAELALGLILSTARRIPYLDAQTRQGSWVRSTGVELQGKTLGVIGLGAIGKLLARFCQAIGMEVIAYDPYINRDYCVENSIEPVELQELLSRAHVISLHLPLNSSTRHMIDREAIGIMRPGAILINSSRGAIIDEAAAYEALVSGKLGGLGLDAFETEPPTGSPLLTLPNVTLTPHTGAHTKEASLKMQGLAVDNLIRVLSGQECAYKVN